MFLSVEPFGPAFFAILSFNCLHDIMGGAGIYKLIIGYISLKLPRRQRRQPDSGVHVPLPTMLKVEDMELVYTKHSPKVFVFVTINVRNVKCVRNIVKCVQLYISHLCPLVFMLFRMLVVYFNLK